jgi:two-component system chemotaxis response regulator CheB
MESGGSPQPRHPRLPFVAAPVIALVASAGGLDALSRVLGGLPAEMPAAVVALMHVDPQRASRLAEILDQRSALPVTWARDGMELRAGRVLVAPPGRHLLIAAGRRAILIESGAFPPNRPSADLLLTTLAIEVGADAIAVVLSGTGHDAATGVSAIQKFGGAVLATSAASSWAFGMPAATIEREHGIARVVDLDDLAGLLVAEVTR